jgi:mono/diheme cytochrome c family protein
MRSIRAILVFVVLVLIAGVVYMYSGRYDVSARSGHSQLVAWVLETTRSRSIAAHAAEITEVPDLNDRTRVVAGAREFDHTCTECHTAPGAQESGLSRGLSPSPPDLAESGDLSPAEMFWIVSRGIDMTGMPAWGVSQSDEDLWSVVAFLRVLPSLSAADYRTLVEEGGRASAPDEASSSP